MGWSRRRRDEGRSGCGRRTVVSNAWVVRPICCVRKKISLYFFALEDGTNPWCSLPHLVATSLKRRMNFPGGNKRHYVCELFGSSECGQFFQDWGGSTCLINGFESRSVAHDVCLRLAMTGTTQPNGDDWAALIANEAGPQSLMPLVHISGPSYTFDCGESVVRVARVANPQIFSTAARWNSSDTDVSLPANIIQAIEDEAVMSQAEVRALAAAKVEPS